MGKPLLTDEMIERARRGEDITGPNMVDAEETKIIRTDHRGFGYERPMRESRMERPQERYSHGWSGLFVFLMTNGILPLYAGTSASSCKTEKPA